MELRQVWLGKAPAQVEAEPVPSMMEVMPGEAVEAPDQPASSHAPPAPAAEESRKRKEMRDLQAHLKQLNAKTNLLDLATEVFNDEKLLSYGWMNL